MLYTAVSTLNIREHAATIKGDYLGIFRAALFTCVAGGFLRGAEHGMKEANKEIEEIGSAMFGSEKSNQNKSNVVKPAKDILKYFVKTNGDIAAGGTLWATWAACSSAAMLIDEIQREAGKHFPLAESANAIRREARAKADPEGEKKRQEKANKKLTEARDAKQRAADLEAMSDDERKAFFDSAKARAEEDWRATFGAMIDQLPVWKLEFLLERAGNALATRQEQERRANEDAARRAREAAEAKAREAEAAERLAEEYERKAAEMRRKAGQATATDAEIIPPAALPKLA